MSDVQQAMVLLMAAFEKYAGKDEDNATMTKKELKEMLQIEFGDLLGNVNDKTALDSIFTGMDADKDNKVDFKEFVTMVACITTICHEQIRKRC